jgi:glycosyltransferase involved in cell wall biosynthesis
LSKKRIIHLGTSLGLDEQSLILRFSEKIYRKIWRITHSKRAKVDASPLKKPLDISGTDLPQLANLYHQRRKEIVSLINQYVDVAISVSERTKSIHKYYGVATEKLYTQYIGSKATEFPVPENNPASYSIGQPFKLIYMGPARKDKGFYYLLAQLRCLSQEELQSLDLVIASRVDDYIELMMAIKQRGNILSLAQSLHRLRYYPGYTYENIPNILNGIHLGVVPPLWEDNLPQVVYELLACRVPVLCSNRGGAQEFVRHPAFIFDPDIEGDFQHKLRTIRQNPSLLKEFWKEANQVKSIKQDFKELLEIYQNCTALVAR